MLVSGLQRPGWREQTTGKEKKTQGNAGSRQWPQALMGEAELRSIIRNKKRKHHERQTERMEKKQRQRSNKQKESGEK